MVNNTDFPDDDDFILAIPPDMAPEDALEVIIGLCYEMRHSLNKIDGILAALAERGLAEIDPQAVGEIGKWMGGIRYILNIVYAYDEQREL